MALPRSSLVTTPFARLPAPEAHAVATVIGAPLDGPAGPFVEYARHLAQRGDPWATVIERQLALEAAPDAVAARDVRRGAEMVRNTLLELGWKLRLVRGFVRSIEWDGVAALVELDRFLASLVAARLRTVRLYRLGDAEVPWLLAQPLRRVPVVQLKSHAFSDAALAQVIGALPNAMVVASQHGGASMAQPAHSRI